MSVDQNTKLISNSSKKFKLLLDTSAYCRFEDIYINEGFDVLGLFQRSENFDCYITSSVLVELMNGPRNSKFISTFKEKILNDEGSFSTNTKFRNLIIEEDGELKTIKLYGVSPVDFSEILLCQNHPELILVSNDIKLIKDATVILNSRIKGVPNVIDMLLKNEKVSSELTYLKQFIDLNRKPIGNFDLKLITEIN
jgi:hypothetical protein